MFGIGSCLAKDNVDLIIQLDRWLPSREYTRIGVEEDDVTEEILNVPIPKIVVPVTGGRSMSVIIESAVMNMQLKADGFDSSKEFVNRIMKNIKMKGE
jgi:HPr kinase/phosphorylase